MKLSYKKELNIYLMENHQKDKVTSYFSYQNFLHICKKLNKETELKQIISNYRETISFLEIENQNYV